MLELTKDELNEMLDEQYGCKLPPELGSDIVVTFEPDAIFDYAGSVVNAYIEGRLQCSDEYDADWVTSCLLKWLYKDSLIEDTRVKIKE